MKRFFLKVIRNIIYGSLMIILLIGVIVFLFLCYMTWLAQRPLWQDKFDSKRWQEAIGTKLNERCGMYYDLSWNYLHKGMSIKEVEKLVGEQDFWVYCKDNKTKCFLEPMGVCYSNALSIVPRMLWGCFNREGKLVSYGLGDQCETKGNYDSTTKEQECFKRDDPNSSTGSLSRSNDCGIDPW